MLDITLIDTSHNTFENETTQKLLPPQDTTEQKQAQEQIISIDTFAARKAEYEAKTNEDFHLEYWNDARSLLRNLRNRGLNAKFNDASTTNENDTSIISFKGGFKISLRQEQYQEFNALKTQETDLIQHLSEFIKQSSKQIPLLSRLIEGIKDFFAAVRENIIIRSIFGESRDFKQTQAFLTSNATIQQEKTIENLEHMSDDASPKNTVIASITEDFGQPTFTGIHSPKNRKNNDEMEFFG
jgi:hypothetical protein